MGGAVLGATLASQTLSFGERGSEKFGPFSQALSLKVLVGSKRVLSGGLLSLSERIA
jgi:hypothetical protein